MRRIWDEVESFERETVRFDMNPQHTLTFEADEPESGEDAKGRPFDKYNVIESGQKRVLMVRSRRLTALLKNNSPLQGKTLVIKRFGRGKSTTYRVSEVITNG